MPKRRWPMAIPSSAAPTTMTGHQSDTVIERCAANAMSPNDSSSSNIQTLVEAPDPSRRSDRNALDFPVHKQRA